MVANWVREDDHVTKFVMFCVVLLPEPSTKFPVAVNWSVDPAVAEPLSASVTVMDCSCGPLVTVNVAVVVIVVWFTSVTVTEAAPAWSPSANPLFNELSAPFASRSPIAASPWGVTDQLVSGGINFVVLPSEFVSVAKSWSSEPAATVILWFASVIAIETGVTGPVDFFVLEL